MTALLSRNPLHLNSTRYQEVQIKIVRAIQFGVKCKLRKGGHHSLNGEDSAASSMKRTTQRPRRRGGRLRPGRRAVATPDARRPRQCIHQTCRPALTDGKQAAVAAWEANNGASRIEQQHPRREEKRAGAVDKHLRTKIFVGISTNVGIGRAESRPKSGTRWGKYWTRGNFGKCRYPIAGIPTSTAAR